jgi:hypothetical protein
MNKAKLLSIASKNNYSHMAFWDLIVEEAGGIPFYTPTTDTEDFRLPNGEIIHIDMVTRGIS